MCLDGLESRSAFSRRSLSEDGLLIGGGGGNGKEVSVVSSTKSSFEGCCFIALGI